MASIEINPKTGRPFNVYVAESGKYFGAINKDGRFVSGPHTSSILTAKRHAEMIRALMGTGASNKTIHNAVNGALN